MGRAEVEQFLAHLAVDNHVSASTQNQALSALLFLYNYVLEQPIGYIDVLWAKKPKRLPVVLTRHEVNRIIACLTGTPLLVVQLLYGGGLRLNEALGLRVKDVDFGQHLLIWVSPIFVRKYTVGIQETSTESFVTIRSDFG